MEVPGDVDESKQVEESGEGEMKENDDIQQQEMVDEEVRSITGSEGRKVGRKKKEIFLFWNQ